MPGASPATPRTRTQPHHSKLRTCFETPSPRIGPCTQLLPRGHAAAAPGRARTAASSYLIVRVRGGAAAPARTRRPPPRPGPPAARRPRPPAPPGRPPTPAAPLLPAHPQAIPPTKRLNCALTERPHRARACVRATTMPSQRGIRVLHVCSDSQPPRNSSDPPCAGGRRPAFVQRAALNECLACSRRQRTCQHLLHPRTLPDTGSTGQAAPVGSARRALVGERGVVQRGAAARADGARIGAARQQRAHDVLVPEERGRDQRRHARRVGRIHIRAARAQRLA